MPERLLLASLLEKEFRHPEKETHVNMIEQDVEKFAQ